MVTKKMDKVITLQKDWKVICTTKCPDPPAELPQNLNINSIIPKKRTSSLSGLPHFALTPAPASQRDQNEWGRFLSFLHKYDMVAIANFEQYKFHILPPTKPSTSTAVRVAYQIDKTCTVDSSPRDCESGSHLAEEHAGTDTGMVRGPASGADVFFSDLKFPQVEDRAYHSTAETCSRPQSHVVKQDRCSEKNYIRADPGYLKTLGQAHSGWIFGGIAELVDNSRDAKATKTGVRDR